MFHVKQCHDRTCCPTVQVHNASVNLLPPWERETIALRLPERQTNSRSLLEMVSLTYSHQATPVTARLVSGTGHHERRGAAGGGSLLVSFSLFA
jgi:hypothetical protein